VAEPSDTESALRIAADASILRRSRTGIARYAQGLFDALDALPDVEVSRHYGPRRVGNGIVFRPVNVALQRWWYEVGMRRAARAIRADALLMPAGFACRRGAAPQLVTIHDVNFKTIPGTYEPAFVRYATWAYGRSAREADAIATDSEFSKGEIVKHLGADPGRVHVVYPGLDPAPPPAGAVGSAPIGRPYALYVGATEKHKNVGLLLDVWERHAPADLTLAIVGAPGRDHRRILERSAPLGDRVVVVGRVGGAELEAWYRGASVFLFPSLTEGFGYPPLEAMLRGVPVVAAAAGSLPEVLGDAAQYHSPSDAEEARVRIDTVLHDSALRESMVQAGLRRAASYSWPAAASETRRILERLLRR